MTSLRLQLAFGQVVLATALLLVGLAVGVAASLPLSTRTLGAAKVGVPRCTTAATNVISNLSGSSLVSVTISNLPGACGGATVQAAINNGTSSSSGSATVPAGGGSVTVTLSAAVAASTTAQTDVVLTGP